MILTYAKGKGGKTYVFEINREGEDLWAICKDKQVGIITTQGNCLVQLTRNIKKAIKCHESAEKD